MSEPGPVLRAHPGDERGIRDRAEAVAQILVANPASPEMDSATLHHLVRVLRVAEGEIVVATDGRGSYARGHLRAPAGGGTRRRAGAKSGSASPGTWTVELIEDVRIEPAPLPPVTVAFALAKGDRPEWVVQKLSELGVDRIVPLTTERSVVRWEGAKATAGVDRLRRIALEASCQCRRVHFPTVEDVSSLAMLSEVSLADLGGSPLSASETSIAVGPEGGWSDAERVAGGSRGFVGLGPTVLRAETAAVTAGVLLTARRAGVLAMSSGVRGTVSRDTTPSPPRSIQVGG